MGRGQDTKPDSGSLYLRQRVLTGEFVRFAAVRAICTVLTFGGYLLLLRWLRYEAAYVISFIAGIALAYAVSALFVFREPMRAQAALKFPLVYLVQFVAIFFLLRLMVETLHAPASWALAISIAVTFPLTFLLSRWIVRSG